MRTHGKMAGAFLVLALAVAGCGAAPERTAVPAAADADPYQFSMLGMLREVHRRMVTERLPLREALVVGAAVRGRDIALTLVPGAVLWSPPGAVALPATPVTYTVSSVPEAEAAYWSSAGVSTPVLAVMSRTELLAVAPAVTAGGEVVRLGFTPTGPLFLAAASYELADSDYTPVPAVVDHCGNATPDQVADTARAALRSYFEIVGTVPELVRVLGQDELSHQAYDLAAQAPRTIDEVTGNPVGVSPNDLLDQLVHGVRPEDLRYEPTVPVTVDLAGVAPWLQDEPAYLAVVMVDTTTNVVLGWIPAAAAWQSEDDGPGVPRFDVTAEIRQPALGSSVGFLLRDLSDERFDCSPGGGTADWQVVVPYDAIAGTRRATVSLRTHSYTAASRP